MKSQPNIMIKIFITKTNFKKHLKLDYKAGATLFLTRCKRSLSICLVMSQHCLVKVSWPRDKLTSRARTSNLWRSSAVTGFSLSDLLRISMKSSSTNCEKENCLFYYAMPVSGYLNQDYTENYTEFDNSFEF